ncbi:MAG: glycosyltransferase [Acetatifactor muris]|nr:glycosyltransferase [Acetatifactor muris]
MGEKISVIIPVYKVDAYLAECLDSVVNQTYRDMEIILVDDASPDGCGAICDRYAAEDARVRVIHKEKNCGQAAARNTGIELAAGEYLFFADSDDWLAEDTLEKLYQGLQNYQADCSVGACVTVLEGDNGEKTVRHCEQKGDRCETALKAMEHTLLSGSAAWNRLFRKEALGSLRFPLGRINDDECFILRVYQRMEKIVFLDCETYFYRKRANSITTSAFSIKMVDCVYNSRENLDFVREKAPELVPAAQYKYCKTLLWCYVNLRKLKKDEQAKNLCRQLHGEIRKNRKAALANPYLGLPLKVLTLLCIL